VTEPEWPLLPAPDPAEPTAAAVPTPEVAAPEVADAPVGPTCPSCGRPIDPAAWFCEACGSPLVPTAPTPAAPAPGPDAPSAQTRRLGVRASEQARCSACGGTIGSDGYCQTCGAKAPSPRDHFSASPADWVGGVCDRGVQHYRNEDALALWADGDRAVLVVCDGVSTSVDSDVAALAGAERARDVLAGRAALGQDASDEVLAQALAEAVAQANQAVIGTTAADSTNAASATFAAAVVVGNRVHYANLGDSRVYLLGPAQRLLLSLDDSMAQAFIAEGMPRAEAEALPRAHAITKWLGRDAVDTTPRTGVQEVTGPGWVLVCSDGLWNYASGPDELAAQLDAALATTSDPVAAAQLLVEWANAQGGHDNVTVALARVPAPTDGATGAPGTAVSLGAAAGPDEAAGPEEKESPTHG